MIECGKQKGFSFKHGCYDIEFNQFVDENLIDKNKHKVLSKH